MSASTDNFTAVNESVSYWKLCVCGFNGFRQLSSNVIENGDIIDEPIEVVNAGDNITKVESSLTSTFILWKDGKISVTGWIPGTTNTGTTNDLLSGQVVQDIACINDNLMLVTKAGKLLSWNDYTHKDSRPDKVETCQLVSQVRCGDLHFIITMDNGCIGEVVPTSSKEEPESKESSLMVNEINFVHEVQSVDCGKEHVLLLTTTAKVFSFGGGSRGQQGNGCLEAQITPQLVEALDGIEITQITCGGWHSAVISNSGDVYCWGWNKDGQVGVTDTEGSQSVQIQAVPFPLTFSDNSDVIVVSVSCGSRHTAVVTSCDEVWTWGWGFYGQLGHGSRNTCHQPTKVLSIQSQVSIAWCSHWHTFILAKHE